MAAFSVFLLPLAGQRNYEVVPKPLQLTPVRGMCVVEKTIPVFADTTMLNVKYLTDILGELCLTPSFVDSPKKAVLSLTVSKVKDQHHEAYQLRIEKDRITVTAEAKAGLLHAMQTIRQLAKMQGDSTVMIPFCSVRDEPAFQWRAFMLDESRHFQGKETVKRLLDEMAYLKMNTFHWHLVDDPGWRIEIKKYPRLTQIGSKRNFSQHELTPAEWDKLYPERAYYTQSEIREIVAYADVRGIRIIPEIEMPGHASAAIAAYPWLGTSSRVDNKPVWGDLYQVTDPRVRNFLENVMDEVIAMFPSKIIHIGGDEAGFEHWQNSERVNTFMKTNRIPTYSDLQLWAINKMSDYLESKGCRMIGWNEITGDNIRNEANVQAAQLQQLAEGTIVQFWDGEVSLINKAIAKGYDVVNSNRFYTYLDYPYDVTPLEKAYAFNPIPDGIADKEKAKIYGLGCQIWGEYTPNLTRLYYQTFPRIAAFAECGWTKAENKVYEEFSRRARTVERRWRKMGYFNQQPSYAKQGDTFTLWQLPSQENTIGNSYIIRTDDNQLIVIDGGVKEEEDYLRGFISANGNQVSCWFVSHPHSDHAGAMMEIIKDPKGVKISQICQSTFSDSLIDREPDNAQFARDYYEAVNQSGIPTVEASEGLVFTFGHTNCKILGIKNEDLTMNPYNNSSMIVRVWDPLKSVLFLGDAGAEQGDKLLNGPFRNDLDCDYVQMAHHGQSAVKMDFYKAIKFRACLWPTPSWVYDNDAGNGFNTHNLTTIETRNTMDSLKITEQYVSFQGLVKID